MIITQAIGPKASKIEYEIKIQEQPGLPVRRKEENKWMMNNFVTHTICMSGDIYIAIL